MAYYIHWKISFVTLRSGETLTVNIWKAASSQPSIVRLIGGAEPFTTDEDDDEDLFAPIRTQSGYIRIVDGGYDADGYAFDWTDLIPETDVSNAVTLTNAAGTVLWQGFMQAQDFGSTLYGNPQEREFPVQCILSVMQGMMPSAGIQTKNFAYLLDQALTAVESVSGETPITNIIVQGGSYAQGWLLKKVDWQVFMSTGSEIEDDDVTANYNFYQMLEDMCRFWGWTVRVYRQKLYLMCVDDSSNNLLLKMTRAQLTTMAGGTAAGTTTDSMSTEELPEYYCSTQNEISLMRGFSRATVKADVGDDGEVLSFAPPSLEKWMEDMGYTWTGKDGSTSIGYFSTPVWTGTLPAVSSLITGSGTYLKGGFARRQIYSSDETEEATIADVIVSLQAGSENVTQVTLQSLKKRAFGEGALKITADVFDGCERLHPTGKYVLFMRIGIGADRSSAKWFYCREQDASIDPEGHDIIHGWREKESTETYAPWFAAEVFGGRINNSVFAKPISALYDPAAFPLIPLTTGLEGYVFVGIIGITTTDGYSYVDSFELANFAIEYVRSEAIIPTSVTSSARARTLTERRSSTREYTGTSGVNARGDWNADCIFASDNNMKYGFGLLLDTDGTFLGQVTFGSGSMYPEQHLINRVTAYWATTKRKLYVEVQSQYADDYLSPDYKLTLDSITYYPVSVCHNWRDDITRITMLQL